MNYTVHYKNMFVLFGNTDYLQKLLIAIYHFCDFKTKIIYLLTFMIPD